MELQEIKQHLRKGDITLAHEMTGVSISMIKAVLRDQRSFMDPDSKGGKAYVALTKIAQSNMNLLNAVG